MTTTDTQAAIERVREALTVAGTCPGHDDLRTLLAEYDARGKEIEALKEQVRWADTDAYQTRHGLLEVEAERDALKAKLEAVRKNLQTMYHDEHCPRGDGEGGPCSCGLTAALEGSK